MRRSTWWIQKIFPRKPLSIRSMRRSGTQRFVHLPAPRMGSSPTTHSTISDKSLNHTEISTKDIIIVYGSNRCVFSTSPLWIFRNPRLLKRVWRQTEFPMEFVSQSRKFRCKLWELWECAWDSCESFDTCEMARSVSFYVYAHVSGLEQRVRRIRPILPLTKENDNHKKNSLTPEGKSAPFSNFHIL